MRRDNVGIWQMQLPLVNPHPKYIDASPLAEIQRGPTNGKLVNGTDQTTERRNSESAKNLSHYEQKMKQNLKDFKSDSEKEEKSGAQQHENSDHNNKETNPSDKVMSEKTGSSSHHNSKEDQDRLEKTTNKFSGDGDEHWKEDVNWKTQGDKESFDTGKSQGMFPASTRRQNNVFNNVVLTVKRPYNVVSTSCAGCVNTRVNILIFELYYVFYSIEAYILGYCLLFPRFHLIFSRFEIYKSEHLSLIHI